MDGLVAAKRHDDRHLGGDVFVTTALTTNTTSTQLLNDLWPSIDAILDRTAASESVEMGWSSNRSIDEVIGDHLMTLSMWGSASPWPERTESYFARVSTEAAASVLGQVGWRLMNTPNPRENSSSALKLSGTLDRVPSIAATRTPSNLSSSCLLYTS